MEEPGLGPLTIGLLIISLIGAYGASMKAENAGPTMVVMDKHKQNCGGMAGFFGCER